MAPVAWAATASGNEQGGGRPPDQQTAGSQELARSAVVTRIATEIAVDGELDEEIWQRAPTIGTLTQREPNTGEPPSERTDVRLLYDDDYLYIGVMAHDSEPQRVIGTQMARDANLSADDRISIVLDTYRDQRNAFHFATNPSGALVDGLVFANGQSNLEWDAIWTVRTRRTNEGWSVEFAIPFRSLSFPAGRSVWGFNISRHIYRKLEEDRWSGALLQTTNFLQVSEAGQITNLEGVTQGIGLDVRPFAAGRWLHREASGRSTVTGKPGLDMFYNFTPSLKLTATVNTDFGETEVDARQINLSRFSLLFPEKRTFFLEDAGVFSFSNTSESPPGGIPDARAQVIPFFSRQVGLLAGEEVPLDLGVKLTGKVGRTDLGVLDARSGDIPGVSDKNFFVGRVRRNLLRQSHIGALFTDGHPALPMDSRTYGGDLRLATSNFLGRSQNLAFNAYGLRSQNEGVVDDDWSYGTSLEYPNDLFQSELVWRVIGENFRPALGFVSRRNVELFRVGTRINPRPKDFLDLQQMFHGIYYTRFTRLDNKEVESWKLDIIAPIDWHFKSGDAVHSVFWPIVNYERLFAPFQISPGVVLPPGEYRFTRWKNHVATAQKRKVQLGLQWLLGRYWSGHADEIIASVNFKLPPRLNLTFNSNQTFARMPHGNFIARIHGMQVNYSASPFISFSNLVQYDNRSRHLGWQSRVRWILQPGNDLFFVFTQGWIQDPLDGSRFLAEDSKISTKVQYTSRF
ncbi:MAG: carbohydrate binding family 9 domain-containing protein [Acidobacteria bacterium]|nr:carbohydrate binding family 9 domain-containing protein [Acidobacteriota bacterium]